MLNAIFDLDAYCDRIGYAGPREPDLPVLQAVIAGHVAAMAFEDIDVLLGRGVRIDVASIQEKLVQRRRGGYCFEQNGLLEVALESLGFTVQPLAARVIRGLPPTAPATARGHKLLRVNIVDDSYLADVGFGNLTPTAPLALRLEEVQSTPHESYRLMSRGTEFELQARLGDAWDSLYHFPLDPVPAVDYEMVDWFCATFPGSPFIANLIVARPGHRQRSTLFNRRFAIRDIDGKATRRVLNGFGDYHEILVDHFGLSLAEDDVAVIATTMEPHAADEEVMCFFQLSARSDKRPRYGATCQRIPTHPTHAPARRCSYDCSPNSPSSRPASTRSGIAATSCRRRPRWPRRPDRWPGTGHYGRNGRLVADGDCPHAGTASIYDKCHVNFPQLSTLFHAPAEHG
jgi:N-hydroxyarylamine O-acetyltransferase